MEPRGVYEARYGPNLKNVAFLVTCLVFVSAAFLPDMPFVGRVLLVVFFGLGVVMALLFMVDRRVALRVDAKGITLAGGNLRYKALLLSVPWEEVDAVVLWRQHSAANLPYVGLQLRPDSPTLQQHQVVARRAMRTLAPHVPPEVALFSRPVNGWRLDKERLRSAVAHFAPSVEIKDLG
jgi:hypothetical protein